MPRTIQQIKQEISAAFLASEDVRRLYDLSEDEIFSEAFSPASVENLLFHAIATGIQTVEVMMEQHAAHVETLALNTIPATIPWYYDRCLAFRKGYPIVFDTDRLIYDYSPEAKADSKAGIVRYAAVRDQGYSVSILVAGEKDGAPEPLDEETLTQFHTYIEQIKPAGIVVNVTSPKPDSVTVNLTVSLDPLMYHTDGTLIAAPDTNPVAEAVGNYFRTITYGGEMRVSALTDAVQAIDGVRDVHIDHVSITPAGTTDTIRVTRFSHQATGGHFKVNKINITHV